MPEAFLGPGSATVGWLLTYLLHSSALIVTASLITTVVRLRPATRDAIWKTALLGGIVTATAAVLSGGPTADLLTLHERIGSMQPGSGGGDSDAVRGGSRTAPCRSDGRSAFGWSSPTPRAGRPFGHHLPWNRAG